MTVPFVSTLSNVFSGCRPLHTTRCHLVDNGSLVVDRFDKPLNDRCFQADFCHTGSIWVSVCRLCRSRHVKQIQNFSHLSLYLFPCFPLSPHLRTTDKVDRGITVGAQA